MGGLDRDAPAPFERVAIVGFGLIGASVALAARQRWPSMRIVAVDRSAVVESVRRIQVADTVGDDLALAAAADLIVLAAPVCENIRILSELPRHVHDEAVVTDVGSTKRQIAAAAAALPSRLTFVGGHPVAGAAIGGLDAARADLFTNRPWILTTSADQAAAAERLTSFVQGLGARIHVMTAEAHDAQVAYLSHLPQLVASALMHLVGEHAGVDGLALGGGGVKDTTRLASSPVDIWRDIAATNQDNIAHAIDEFVDVLLSLKPGTRAAADPMGTVFDSAAHWKRVLESGGDQS